MKYQKTQWGTILTNLNFTHNTSFFQQKGGITQNHCGKSEALLGLLSTRYVENFMRELTDKMLQDFILKNEGWELIQGRLEKTYQFQNFARAILFVNKIINPIEENQSYPVIRIAYNRVWVSLFNQMEGILTKIELQIAKEMDTLK